ncbi:MAG: transcription-repair coupling factor [Abyssibacter sp.]|uniref:transcription-repair coupling factor n=1 Tax=Abyssibacter sp. TaxID=2320200 RepID=UPI00321B9B1A
MCATIVIDARVVHSSPPIMVPNAPLLQPPAPTRGQLAVWNPLPDSGLALAAIELARGSNELVLLCARDEQHAYQLEAICKFFADESCPVLHFPDMEILPYDALSPLPEVVSERLSALARIPDLRAGVLIVGADNLLQRLPPPAYVKASTLSVQQAQVLPPLALRQTLEAAGYQAVSEVQSHGEYALRGALMDLFPMGSPSPYRIDWLDDEIDSIRLFDPETQRSQEVVPQIKPLPATAFPTDEAGIERFRRQYRNAFTGDLSSHRVYQSVSRGQMPAGIEAYMPLFFEQTGHLSDYLPAGTVVVTTPGVEEALDKTWQSIRARHENLGVDPERPLLPPDQAFVAPSDALQHIQPLARVSICAHAQEDALSFDIEPSPVQTPAVDRSAARARIAELLADEDSRRLLLLTESQGRREELLELLRPLGQAPRSYEGWSRFVGDSKPFGICIAPLAQGFALGDPAIRVITETELIGSKPPATRRRRPVRDPETVLRNLSDLKVGAPVVHQEHGVGRYMGLDRLTVGDQELEFLRLEYAKGDKLYVPVGSLHLIHRYTGAEPDSAPLHALGNDRWSKVRKKAAEKARDSAAELLSIQARRAAKPGHRFDLDAADYARFADGFPFEETPDQLTAIQAVIDDMGAPHPMDRVVCGDVGFGKTEVAMRAAFVAVSNGRQVCLLVPTTLLASQHAQNFMDRFADWPVRIASMSRLRSAKAQTELLEEMREGKVDIVVGTHRLLQKDVQFKDLGLVIVDEEHRFGVRHKEALKRLRAEVDLLTLTATPIPRTLNMSLAGLRDLSIIATPPTARNPIKTFVADWDKALVREACLREIRRGGQVYYLHNEVSSMERAASDLRELLPEAEIRTAHGQMRERELESVMLDFYHQRFNVLVCSTIVESGIDVPTANTIVMDRADKLGLAQLHQLRGRVGRSHHRAYAYLLVPSMRALSQDALKRLEAIESLGELGAGFTLATHDLEIRGAGELLGEEQSGQIEEIGFALYSQLLERAVKALKSGGAIDEEDPWSAGADIDLGVPALIPDDYVPDVTLRLTLYKRISSAASPADLRELKVEMIDRFGLLPERADQLFTLAGLRQRCEHIGIRQIKAGAGSARIEFKPKADVDPAALIAFIQSNPRKHRFDGATTIVAQWDQESPAGRLAAMVTLLDQLHPASAEATA